MNSTAATAPEAFPTNFFVEHFYFNASSVITGGTTKAKLVTAIEAASELNVPAPSTVRPLAPAVTPSRPRPAAAVSHRPRGDIIGRALCGPWGAAVRRR